MRILLLGGHGYLGWPTGMYLSQRGRDVALLDNFGKRQWEAELGVEPPIPIHKLDERACAWEEISDKKFTVFTGDLCTKGAQKRGFLNIRDTLRCWDALAVIILLASFARNRVRWRDGEYIIRNGTLVPVVESA
jgi:nucleoside-diphosphate-sugar epimerase